MTRKEQVLNSNSNKIRGVSIVIIVELKFQLQASFGAVVKTVISAFVTTVALAND